MMAKQYSQRYTSASIIRQRDRQTERQADRQMDRQIDGCTEVHVLLTKWILDQYIGPVL